MTIEREDVHFTVHVHEDAHSSYKDHFSGEDLIWVRDELEIGNQWAWCVVEVRAECPYTGLAESTFQGQSSYGDEDDFLDSPFYEEMCDEVYEMLVDRLEEEEG